MKIKEEKDWSKATDEELIAEAKTYIGKTVICMADGEQYTVEKFDEIFDGGVWMYAEIDSAGVKIYDPEIGWAKIVSQPEAIDHSSHHVDYGISNFNPDDIRCSNNSKEPKAGDMVEVYDFDNQEWLTLEMRYLGVTTSTGAFVCENRNFATETFSKIRLPQKSEVESKAKWFWECEENQDLPAINIIEQAIKWGQQNTNAK